jgi:hypothetical protein
VWDILSRISRVLPRRFFALVPIPEFGLTGTSFGARPSCNTGFKGAAKGKLVPLPNSTRSLSAPSVLPAQVSFSPDNQWLVVTERNGNNIDVFKVRGDGRTSAPTFTLSPVTDTFGSKVSTTLAMWPADGRHASTTT